MARDIVKRVPPENVYAEGKKRGGNAEADA
jgi:hypothetical protein